ncbi:MAG: AraC family ligand binding domain-containing protein [Ardenticatenaceae bacterium]|nr:AraC family ligand binding domain-containing protein [Ardenticatenaceae bacterium]
MHAFHREYAYPRHGHDHFVICLIEHGVQSFTHKGTKYMLPAQRIDPHQSGYCAYRCTRLGTWFSDALHLSYGGPHANGRYRTHRPPQRRTLFPGSAHR